jgi:hypothetical protein
LRASLAALALACALPASSAEVPAASAFPRSGELFSPILADPREIQLGAAYYRLKGIDTADTALGHSWGMVRWHSDKLGGGWKFQWNLEAMGMSRFKLDGAINQFETVDFFLNIPFEIRRGVFSARAMLFHQSSHLGDDYIRRTRDLGFRYSTDGAKVQLGYDPLWWLRAYFGGGGSWHSIPAPQTGFIQFGFEAKTKPLAYLGHELPLTAYIAQDFQSKGNVQHNINSNTHVGLRLRFRDGERSLRMYWAYFDGHSPYGQFHLQREHYSQLGVSFDF